MLKKKKKTMKDGEEKITEREIFQGNKLVVEWLPNIYRL
jgi:hypothetical protein